MWSIGRNERFINEICREQSKECQQSIVHCEGGSHHGTKDYRSTVRLKLISIDICGLLNFIDIAET
jgi:hypothetical protein